MNKTQMAMVAVIVILTVTLGGFFTLIKKHSAETRRSVSYVIDAEFDQVKKIMIRTDALEEIISHEQGQLVGRKWHKLVISSERPLRDGFDIDGRGEFIVAKEDPEVGRIVLRFHQTTHVGKSGLLTETNLMEPVGHIRTIKTRMEMKPEGEKTSVTTSIYLKYERKVPKGMIEEMDRRVTEAAEGMLASNQEAILRLVGRYANKRFIFPIKR